MISSLNNSLNNRNIISLLRRSKWFFIVKKEENWISSIKQWNAFRNFTFVTLFINKSRSTIIRNNWDVKSSFFSLRSWNIKITYCLASIWSWLTRLKIVIIIIIVKNTSTRYLIFKKNCFNFLTIKIFLQLAKIKWFVIMLFKIFANLILIWESVTCLNARSTSCYLNFSLMK